MTKRYPDITLPVVEEHSTEEAAMPKILVTPKVSLPISSKYRRQRKTIGYLRMKIEWSQCRKLYSISHVVSSTKYSEQIKDKGRTYEYNPVLTVG